MFMDSNCVGEIDARYGIFSWVPTHQGPILVSNDILTLYR